MYACICKINAYQSARKFFHALCITCEQKNNNLTIAVSDTVINMIKDLTLKFGKVCLQHNYCKAKQAL